MNELKWKKFPVLNAGHIALVDWMGNDNRIAEAARTSFGNDEQPFTESELEQGRKEAKQLKTMPINDDIIQLMAANIRKKKAGSDDRTLIRYLLNHSHTTPFEMCEVCFHVKVPMDHWRQWVRHRTANVNEYSTRYTEAIDECQTTPPEMWRLQSTDNKQGSSGFLTEWPEDWKLIQTDESDTDYQRSNGVYSVFVNDEHESPGAVLSDSELIDHNQIKHHYKLRLALGVAKEQARKDLPLSNYTQLYWKCDLHNIFNFLRLRMDSHAQYEIRMYANAMAEIVKQLFPVAYEAFEDYVLYAKKFSRMEMEYLKTTLLIKDFVDSQKPEREAYRSLPNPHTKPDSMTNREWKEFLGKLA